MYSTALIILLPLAIFFVAILFVALWDRTNPPPAKSELQALNGEGEGAFRSIYHFLWILILWSGTICFLPLLLSFRRQLEGATGSERIFVVAKVLAFPLIALALLRYGARRGYLSWIGGLSWPDKENNP
jgi:hypothetical protein